MQAAIGPKVVKFGIERNDGERATCLMRLDGRASSFGFTADARFFRPYLRQAEKNLRLVDADLEE